MLGVDRPAPLRSVHPYGAQNTLAGGGDDAPAGRLADQRARKAKAARP